MRPTTKKGAGEILRMLDRLLDRKYRNFRAREAEYHVNARDVYPRDWILPRDIATICENILAGGD